MSIEYHNKAAIVVAVFGGMMYGMTSTITSGLYEFYNGKYLSLIFLHRNFT
jgi:hypothetical protein